MLAELGTPLTAVMDRVGHTDSKITLEIYSHVTEQMILDIANKLDKTKFQKTAPFMPLVLKKYKTKPSENLISKGF